MDQVAVLVPGDVQHAVRSPDELTCSMLEPPLAVTCFHVSALAEAGPATSTVAKARAAIFTC